MAVSCTPKFGALVLTTLFMASLCSAQLISIPVNDSTVIIELPCLSLTGLATQQQKRGGAKEAATDGHHGITITPKKSTNRCPVEKVRAACLGHPENVVMVKKQCCPVLDKLVYVKDCLCSTFQLVNGMGQHRSKMNYVATARGVLKTCAGTHNSIAASLIDRFTCGATAAAVANVP